MITTISTESPKAFFLFLCLSLISVSPSTHTEGVINTAQSIKMQEDINNAYARLDNDAKKLNDTLFAIERKLKLKK